MCPEKELNSIEINSLLILPPSYLLQEAFLELLISRLFFLSRLSPKHLKRYKRKASVQGTRNVGLLQALSKWIFKQLRLPEAGGLQCTPKPTPLTFNLFKAYSHPLTDLVPDRGNRTFFAVGFVRTKYILPHVSYFFNVIFFCQRSFLSLCLLILFSPAVQFFKDIVQLTMTTGRKLLPKTLRFVKNDPKFNVAPRIH